MHDLRPVTALGGTEPLVEDLGAVRIVENSGVALASVAARMGQEAACAQGIKAVLGALPDIGRAVLRDPEAGFWMGPDQWMIGAPAATHEDLADQLKDKLGRSASVTEQTGAWVVFDVTGHAMQDMCALLCNVPVQKMVAGDVKRTMIHQMNCFVIRREAHNHIRILGPRAAAVSLHHALIAAARSVV